MSIYTLRSGASAHPEDSVLQSITDMTEAGGVLSSAHFLVSQKSGTPDMSVDVASGRAYVYDSNLGSNSYPVRSTAVENRAISANASGNPRIDAVVLFIDLSASPVSDGTGVATIQVVIGTPSASPVAPDDSAVFTSIGSANPFIRLAHVTVASGATSIVNADIDDQRPLVQITTPNLVDESAHGLYRQALINGNFDYVQRYAYLTPVNVTAVAQAYYFDRWKVLYALDGGTPPASWTIEQKVRDTGVLNQSAHYCRINVNGAGSGFGTNSGFYLDNNIEHGTKYLAQVSSTQYVTASIWARSTIAGKRIGIALFQNYGTGGSPTTSEPIKGDVFTLTSTWTKYTVRIPLNQLGGKSFGTTLNDRIEFCVWYQWGATFGNTYLKTGVTAESWGGAGTIDITQAQLNVGSIYLPFNPIPQHRELLDCQRYYEKSYDHTQAPGLAAGNSVIQTQQGVNFAGYEMWVPYKVYKADWSVATVIHTYDVAGNIDKISTKAGFAGAYTNNVVVNYSANYMWGFSVYTNNTIQGMAFHYTAEKEF